MRRKPLAASREWRQVDVAAAHYHEKSTVRKKHYDIGASAGFPEEGLFSEMRGIGRIGTLRERLVVPRRTAVLADTLSRALFDAQTALDVGCGEGSIDLLIEA